MGRPPQGLTPGWLTGICFSVTGPQKKAISSRGIYFSGHINLPLLRIPGANLDANGTAGTELITGRSGCPCVQLHSQATHLANVLPCLWLWVAVLGASLHVGRV